MGNATLLSIDILDDSLLKDNEDSSLLRNWHKLLSNFLMKQSERLSLEMAANPIFPKTSNRKELLNAHKKAIIKQINDWWTFIDFDEFSKLKSEISLKIVDPYEEYLELKEQKSW